MVSEEAVLDYIEIHILIFFVFLLYEPALLLLFYRYRNDVTKWRVSYYQDEGNYFLFCSIVILCSSIY